MLTRFRIEVEEQTVSECVEALAKYQHALQALEASRFRDQWPVELTGGDPITDGDEVVGYAFPSSDEPGEIDATQEQYPVDVDWKMRMLDRQFYTDELGAEVTEEIIEYDASIPGYKGRRVVKLTRLDTRNETFLSIKPYIGFTISGMTNQQPNSGTNP